MMKIKSILVVICISLLGACADSNDSAQSQQQDQQLSQHGQSDNHANKQTSKQTQGHMLSDQETLIQKAKDAEKLIKEAEKKRRKVLNDQGE